MTQRAGVGLESLRQDSTPTFREHMRDTWQTKPDFGEMSRRPESLDKMGQGIYWVTTIVIVFSAVFYSIPEFCQVAEDMADTKIFLIILVLLNSGAANMNWFLAAMKNTHMVKQDTISDEEQERLRSSPYLPLGYKFCHKCNTYAPPRSFHCTACNGCILKRDYHCYITGSCIGLTTQRRFMALLFHVMLGSFMHMVLSAHYVHGHLPFTENYLSYFPFMAFYKWTTGTMHSDDLYFLCLAYTCLGIMLVSAAYLAWQWLMVIRGQTSFEATRSVQTYRMGFYKSMYQVFGSVWWMNFIFPMPTTLPTDGVHWERRGQNKTS